MTKQEYDRQTLRRILRALGTSIKVFTEQQIEEAIEIIEKR